MTHLSPDEIVRWARGSATLNGTTFVQTAISLPVSTDDAKLALIHRIEFYGYLMAANGESISMAVTRTSQTAMVSQDSAELLAFYQTIRFITTSGSDKIERPFVLTYPIPLLFPYSTIYLGVSASNAATATLYVRIGFQLVKYSDKDLLKVLVASGLSG